MKTHTNLLVAALALSGFAFSAVAIAADAPTAAQMAQKAQAGANWFGGPIYSGAPALEVTAALVVAGGGAENFSFATALVSLVKAGTTADGVWWSGYLFDKALSHDIHNQVMMDIDASASHAVDEITHKILNQAMYDVAQALKVKGVKLAPLH